MFFVFILLECFFNTIHFKVVTEHKHDNIHVNIKLFLDSVIFGSVAAILVPKNDPKSHFGRVINRFSDMSGPISFKLSMLIVHVGLLMHVIFFRDWIQNGRLAAILFFFVFLLLECFFNTICFKVDAQKKHDKIHVHIKLNFDSQFHFGHVINRFSGIPGPISCNLVC